MLLVSLLIFVLALIGAVTLVKLAYERLTRKQLRLRYALLAILGVLFAIGGAFLLNRPGDRERIETTVEVVATSTDPAVCLADETAGFRQQMTGEPAPFAEAFCESDAGHDQARAVLVNQVTVDGDTATAEAAYTGGSLDGSRVRLGLIEDGRHWKLDRLLGFTHFDRAGFRRAYRRSFLAFGSAPQAAACGVERERRLSDVQVETALLRGQELGFARNAAICDRAGSIRSLTSRVAYPSTALPSSALECVTGRLRSSPTGEIARLQVDPLAYGKLIVGCHSETYLDYLKQVLSKYEGLDPNQVACGLRRVRRLPVAELIRLSYERARIDELVGSCSS